jgi:hypothetical protein
MGLADEVKFAQELIQVFQKARKNLRMYPVNNPIYARTIEEAYKKLEDFVETFGDLDLHIKQNEIMLHGKPVYQSTEKEDNFAFFFFRDGLRELLFARGVTLEEFRDFLQAVSYDFERLGEDEDLVTLLWEQDFEHIKYLIDESFLLEDESYEQEVTSRLQEEATEEGDLKRAYEDAMRNDTAQKGIEIVPVTQADLGGLVRELERDSAGKIPRLSEILFDLYFEQGLAGGDVIRFLNEAIKFTVENEDLAPANHILRTARKAMDDPSTAGHSDVIKRELRQISLFASSLEVIKIIGERLDSGGHIQEEVFDEYVQRLEKDAISSFITVLGELKSIEARKVFINALIFLGGKDLNALGKGLSDPRWYVVRNIIYIFRRIGDKRGVEFLVRAAHHGDARVRMEALRALGELGGQGVVQTLRDALDDPEPSIRTTAARSLGMLKTEPAKKLILAKISQKEFPALDFNEKKEYFEVLANWRDQDTVDFLMRALKASSIFKKSRTEEIKACAAFSLGLIGHKEALSHLHKMRDSKSKLLSEYAYTAIKRIEYGG